MLPYINMAMLTMLSYQHMATLTTSILSYQQGGLLANIAAISYSIALFTMLSLIWYCYGYIANVAFDIIAFNWQCCLNNY